MIFVRHGQSEFNVVYGATRQDPGIVDPKLTEEGREQARRAALILRREGIDRVIASPYTRALETATIIAEDLSAPISIVATVRERAAFTCDIGTPISELRLAWPRVSFDGLAENWWPAETEPEGSVLERCDVFRRFAETLPDRDRVAVVSHWGFIRGLTGLPVTNGTVLRIDPGPTPCPARELTLLG